METTIILGLSPQAQSRLIEMDWGEWEGRKIADLREEMGETMVENEARGLDFRPPGGESPRDVQERLRPLLRTLSGPTIFVTHKGVIRPLYAMASGWTMRDDPPEKLRDGCAHRFEVSPDGTPSVEELNIPLEPAP
jgi:probable phosphoglycerate mutase